MSHVVVSPADSIAPAGREVAGVWACRSDQASVSTGIDWIELKAVGELQDDREVKRQVAAQSAVGPTACPALSTRTDTSPVATMRPTC